MGDGAVHGAAPQREELTPYCSVAAAAVAVAAIVAVCALLLFGL